VKNTLQLGEAIGACGLQGKVTPQLLHYHVQMAQKKMRDQDCLLQAEGMIIEIDEDDATATTCTSPLTEMSLSSSAGTVGTPDDASTAPVVLPTSTTAPAPPEPRSSNKENLNRKPRRSSRQTSYARLQEKRDGLEYSRNFKAAFKEATNAAANPNGSTESVACLVTRLNKKYNLDGKRRLSRSTIYRAVQQGHVGQSPCKMGPPPSIPDVLMDALAAHSEVSQVGNGGELRGRDFKRLIGAAVMGTRHENKFTIDSAWKKLRTAHPEKMQATNIATAEDARLKWTTFENLQQWFDDAKADLIATGLVVDQEVRNESGELLSEVDFRPADRGGDDVKRRIINMDETHHDLSITAEKGGPRSTMYHNPLLQRGYKRTVKAGRHVTGVYATNAAGETLPPMYIFDSSANIESNYRVKVSWLEGLPHVEGRFGCPSRVESGSFYSVRSNGSMDDSLFNDYIDRVILPLYPNISKTAMFDVNTGETH
jgi:hypothetical protein